MASALATAAASALETPAASALENSVGYIRPDQSYFKKFEKLFKFCMSASYFWKFASPFYVKENNYLEEHQSYLLQSWVHMIEDTDGTGI